MNLTLSRIVLSLAGLVACPATSTAIEKPSTAAELFGYTKLWDVEIRISEQNYRTLTPAGGRGFDRDFPVLSGR